MSDDFQITPKQAAGLFIAALTLVAGNSFIPSFRADPFTGTQGKALETRLYELEVWRNDHVKWGYEIAGRRDAQIAELYRLCEK